MICGQQEYFYSLHNFKRIAGVVVTQHPRNQERTIPMIVDNIHGVEKYTIQENVENFSYLEQKDQRQV